MTRKKLLFVSLFAAAILAAVSCKHRIEDLNAPGSGNGGGSGNPGSGNAACDPAKVYFQQQVLPVLVSNCAMSGCHDDASHEEGVILTSFEKVMNTGGIRPGNPGESKLYKVIIDTNPDDRMPRPPQNPLTAEQILLIRRWIEQGAQNLVCQSLCDSNSYTYSGAIKNIISSKCQGCHSGAAPQGGVDLSTYNAVKAKVTDGRLWGSISQLPGFFPMPKNGTRLSDCELAQFRKWIDAGALNN